MKNTHKIPVVILNGFLGSGKTTLFRNLIADAEKKDISICAIVNDMSDLDVDGEVIGGMEYLEENGDILRTISNCVLSSQHGLEQLDQALEALLSNQQPQLILIETSGSAHPMPLIEYFKSHTKTKLTAMFALVDTLMLSHDFEDGKNLMPKFQFNLRNHKRDTVNLLAEQILFCSHLILTKSDRIPEEKLSEIAQTIHPINPLVSILSVVFGRMAIEELLNLPEYNYHRVAQLADELRPVLEQESKTERPYDLATRVIKDERPFHPERLWQVCHQYLDQRIYRSKGFFWLASRDQMSLLWSQAAGGINLEMIGTWRAGILEDENNDLNEEEYQQLQEMLENENETFGDRHCHLTIIGDENHVDQFTDALKECFLTDEEVMHWEMGGDFDDPWPQNIVKLN